jgi:hypothetical protein
MPSAQAGGEKSGRFQRERRCQQDQHKRVLGIAEEAAPERGNRTTNLQSRINNQQRFKDQ